MNPQTGVPKRLKSGKSCTCEHDAFDHWHINREGPYYHCFRCHECFNFKEDFYSYIENEREKIKHES